MLLAMKNSSGMVLQVMAIVRKKTERKMMNKQKSVFSQHNNNGKECFRWSETASSEPHLGNTETSCSSLGSCEFDELK